MSKSFSELPEVIHTSIGRVRLRWKKLFHPGLDSEYLEAWLEALPGVKSARINPRSFSAAVTFSGSEKMVEAIRQRLAEAPNEVFERNQPAAPPRRMIDVATSGALAAASPFMPTPLKAAVACATGLPAIMNGLDTLVNKGLKVQVLDMSTIGFSLLRRDYTAATSIAAMVVAGEYFRQTTEDRTNNLLRSLMIAPVEKVSVIRDGQQAEVGFEEVCINDIVRCTVGEIVPVDGIITHGDALIDRSSISGESLPVHCMKGDNIISGSHITEGTVEIKAVRVGPETSMKRIAHLMENTVRRKSKPERDSDRLADMLAPITLGAGAAIYAATNDADKALSALTVDYACAVKLPTPVVIKSSMYAAARHKVMIKSGSALDKIASVDTVIFDKTGTLTKGDLFVTETISCGRFDRDTIVTMAAAAENRSFHPVGRAILAEANRTNLDLPRAENGESTVAHGVCMKVDDSIVRVGSHHYIQDDCGIDCSCVEERASHLRGNGNILIYVTIEEKLEGVISMQDELRPEAAEILQKLKKDGVKEIIVLTGDHRETAISFGKKLPEIDSVRWGLKPEEKAALVQELRQDGKTVAFVGDGVNDAPSLIEADVGISVPGCTDLAREAAQIVLTGNNLEGILLARSIGRQAGRTLKGCFTAGVGVNTGLLLAATAGLLTPVTAALIHNLTTFSILGTSALISQRIPQIN